MKVGRLAILVIVLFAATGLVGALLGIAPWRTHRGERPSENVTQRSGQVAEKPLSPNTETAGSEPKHEWRESVTGSPREGEAETGSGMQHGESIRDPDPGEQGEISPQKSPPPQESDANREARSAQGSAAPTQPAVSDPKPMTGASEGSRVAPVSPGGAQPADETAKADSPPDESPSDKEEDGNLEHNAPVLQSLRFDPPQVADGNATMLLIQLTDHDLSGARVSVSIQSPSGAATLRFEAQGEGGNNVIPMTIPIPSKAEAGAWFVSGLNVIDRADYSLSQAFTARTVPAGGKILVASSEPDTSAPQVRNISVTRGPWRNGDSVPIKVQVDDDHSGVATIVGAFQSPSKTALLWFEGRLNTESSLWEGEIRIPVNSDCGEWDMSQIRAVDNAGNAAQLLRDSPTVAPVAFSVTSPNGCDSTPPVLETFFLSPLVVFGTTGAEVMVTATISDEGSGAASAAGWADGPISTNGQAPRIHFSCARAPSNTEGLWTAKIVVPQNAAKGVWRVGMVQLRDGALNTRDYSPDDAVIAHANFQVE